MIVDRNDQLLGRDERVKVACIPCVGVRRLASKVDKGLVIIGVIFIVAGSAELAVGCERVGECGDPLGCAGAAV